MTFGNSNQPTLNAYYEAAYRIFNNTTNVLPKDSKMTIKNVALEAGKSPSSIRKDRDIFIPLIEDITKMAEQMAERLAPGQGKAKDAQLKTKKAKAKAKDFESRYIESLSRELMLIRALDEAQRALRSNEEIFSQHENVLPFPKPRK
ncbi:hypothetical protein F3J45_23015 [Pantoea sp. Ap-967]|uniref:hypothetical protein n=1 Tax=Pantoea sp. Ap-967 TaxID=2608362 RepID=UPI001423873F|nr:hypothetical protein [Pantoea sp. Ap-967]NIE77310.1 hypothetical protein [Pantoea sp. Ap-967]